MTAEELLLEAKLFAKYLNNIPEEEIVVPSDKTIFAKSRLRDLGQEMKTRGLSL